MKRLLVPVAGIVLLNPISLLATGVLIRKARREHPGLFDPEVAAESVALCVTEYAAQYN